MRFVLVFFSLLSYLSVNAQDWSTTIFSEYENFKEPSLVKRQFTHQEIQPLLQKLSKYKAVTTTVLGTSIEGKTITMLTVGNGPTKVLLWSQMHGDESTATMAIFDVLNYLTRSSDTIIKHITNKLTLHFIPMLNPDGAEFFKRRNAINIDINRDALRLQSNESKILKRVRDSLTPDFGFNLHDQSKYYNATNTPNTATISFLAPAFNYKKDVNDVRGNAMKLIAQLNTMLQNIIPGKVAKYNDDFEPRAFGDNIQKWGTSTILVESGGYPNDPEKQFIRKLNYVLLLTAFKSIALQEFKNFSLDNYWSIPENDRKLFDLKISNINYNYASKNFVLDLGINHLESYVKNATYYQGAIQDIGDLSTHFGYQTIDAQDLYYAPAKVHPKTFNTIDDVKTLNALNIIKDGIVYVKVKNITKPQPTQVPFIIVPENFTPSPKISFGSNPSFLLVSGKGKIKYVVVNGFVVAVDSENLPIKNGWILKK